MENIFDCLSFALEEDLCKQFFIDGEGVELCIIMMKCVSLHSSITCAHA